MGVEVQPPYVIPPSGQFSCGKVHYHVAVMQTSTSLTLPKAGVWGMRVEILGPPAQPLLVWMLMWSQNLYLWCFARVRQLLYEGVLSC